MMALIDDFVSDPDGLRLIEAFMRIDNAALRRRIVMLVQEIALIEDLWPELVRKLPTKKGLNQMGG